MSLQSQTNIKGRGVLAAAGAAVLMAVGVAGCGVNSSEPASSPSASVSATAEAWTRGTVVNITNNSGQTVDVITGSFVNSYPRGQSQPLATGSSISASDPSGYTGSDVGTRFTFADGNSVDIRLINPVIGTPEVQWRRALNIDWDNFPGDSKSLDEGQSFGFTIDGHSFTAARLGDDSENKNWTLTVNS